jgi:hypothetical protein
MEQSPNGSACTFCRGTAEPRVYQGDGVAICAVCVDKARTWFDSQAKESVSIELAYGGHDDIRLQFRGPELVRLVDALVEARVVASIDALEIDQRLRVSDFLPNPDGVASEERVQASYEAMGAVWDELWLSWDTTELERIREFLSLATFHGGFVVRAVA